MNAHSHRPQRHATATRNDIVDFPARDSMLVLSYDESGSLCGLRQRGRCFPALAVPRGEKGRTEARGEGPESHKGSSVSLRQS